MTAAPPRRTPERAVVEAAARHLAAAGYRVYVDPDGTDYFDLVARRGDEVGLVEAKVGDRRKVLRQAVRRRAWGDWCAVVLTPERAARKLESATATGRLSAVGVWTTAEDTVRVLRPARPWGADAATDPFGPLKRRFRAVLDAVDRGELPSGVAWDGLLGEVRRASGGRWFSEWRLDELADGSD